MNASNQLVIVGDSAFAEVAYEYFTYDSPYEVVAFSVESDYLTKPLLFGKPVVPFEALETLYPPSETAVFVAIVYTQVNRLRQRLFLAAKQKGYAMASYISPKAFLWHNVQLGEHCFIFENNVLQPFVTIGDNVILWSGNHIGHHSTIGNHCFISSHVVISGFVNLHEFCFLGVNSTIANNVTLASDVWVGPNVTVTKDIPANTLLKPTKPRISPVSTLDYFSVRDHRDS